MTWASQGVLVRYGTCCRVPGYRDTGKDTMRFEIATGTPEPIYRQIARQVRAGVASGGLAPRERLPSVRELARELLVNPNTVQRAYAELEREEVLHTVKGKGTFVAADLPAAGALEARARLEGLVDSLLEEAGRAGLALDEVFQAIRERAGARA